MCCNFCKPLRVQIAVKFQVSTCNLAIPPALKCLKHESLLTFVESVRLAGVPLFTLRPHPSEIREALQCLRLWFLEFWAVLPLWLRLSMCATQTEKRGTQCEVKHVDADMKMSSRKLDDPKLCARHHWHLIDIEIKARCGW